MGVLFKQEPFQTRHTPLGGLEKQEIMLDWTQGNDLMTEKTTRGRNGKPGASWKGHVSDINMVSFF